MTSNQKMINKKETELDDVKLHYIIGLGRSGTTLLLRELGKSKHVLSNPESLFILDFLYVQNSIETMTPGEISFFMERVFTLKTGRFVSLDIWNVDKTRLIECIKNQTYIRFIDLIKLVNLNSKFGLKKNNVRTIIDKNPPHTLHVEKLIKLDDNSKFIGIYRSYLDNIISRNKYKLDAFNHPYYHALIWCRYNEELLKSKELFHDKIHLVKYEELVENPEFYLSEIRSFLNIENEQQIEETSRIEELLNSLKTENEKEQFLAMHGRAFQDIDNKSIGKKTIPFDSKKINAIHWICSGTSLKMGYEPIAHSCPNFAIRFQIMFLKFHLFVVEFKHHFFYRSSHKTRRYLKFVFKPQSILFNKS